MRLLLGLLAVATVSYADVFSCGGFVKSPVPIDYGSLKVKLLTPEGHLKSEESVNAVNGYYMIPVYAKGAYSIRIIAPDGWFFEPSSYEFKLDGVTDACTKEEDINFSLVGFGIDGVVEAANGQGPVGLKLNLEKEGKVIARTTTTEGGKYHFKAPPGEYRVSAESGSAVCISHAESVVQVKTSPVKVTPSLRISGYPVEISVAKHANVKLLVYAKNDPKLNGCRRVASTDDQVEGFSTVCEAGQTDANGIVPIPCLAPGDYRILPKLKGIHFEPSIGSLTVKSESTKLSFTVSGFTAKGRVTVDGKPFPNVEVTVGGKVVDRTNERGEYTIAKAKEGTIDVTATAKATRFSKVSQRISVQSSTVADIVVEGFEVCGSVEKNADGVVEALVLAPKSGKGDSSSIRADASGKFCKYVAPGVYVISPARADSSLAPRSRTVDATRGGVSDISFTHFKTTVEATVACTGQCEPMALSLVSRDGVVVSTVQGVDTFLFNDVSSGKYTVRVPSGGRFCWQSTEVAVVVEQTKPAPVHLVQNGFNAYLTLGHAATIDWKHAEAGAKGTVQGERGMNVFCLPTSGSYVLQLSSCMKFDKSTLTVTVPSDARLEAFETAASIKGRVEGAQVSKDTVVTVTSSAGKHDVAVAADGTFSFYEPLATAGQKITLTPKSATFLFDPTSRKIAFEGDCITEAVVFAATKGIFIDGSVSPPVADVDVEAVHKRDANVILHTKTDANGRFRLGPVRVAEDLEISATKDGYAFTRTDKHAHLKSAKLSQLTLTFEDVATKERLNDVILYVRGGNGEKAQHKVEKDGQIRLASLTPGTLIRVLLQEYEFEQPTITVTMKEGEHDEKIVKGKRTSYSAYGRIVEMSGSAVADVAVEALSEQCDQHQSETLTDAKGAFRVRGLKPGCNYRVSLRAQEGKPSPPHCFPSTFDVKMTAEDVKGLDMVTAPQDEGAEVLVDVRVEGAVAAAAQRQSLRVSVTRQDGDVVATDTLPNTVGVYALRGLQRDGSEYTVKVWSDANSPTAVQMGPSSASFTADKAVNVVRLTVTPSKSANDVEISKGSIFAVLFFACLAMFVTNPQEWIERAKALAVKLQQAAPSSPQLANAKKRK